MRGRGSADERSVRRFEANLSMKFDQSVAGVAAVLVTCCCTSMMFLKSSAAAGVEAVAMFKRLD